uniref:Putative ovule protein n=1 Tax=Solanum chacoense TaxID=4108 RepID=A0A0V0GS60_SOLCH
MSNSCCACILPFGKLEIRGKSMKFVALVPSVSRLPPLSSFDFPFSNFLNYAFFVLLQWMDHHIVGIYYFSSSLSLP